MQIETTGNERRRRMLAYAVWAFGSLAVVAGILMQVESGQWLPPEHSVSQYANSDGRWWFAIGLFTLGLATLALAALTRAVGRDRYHRAAVIALAIAGVGFVLAAAIPAPAVGEQDALSDGLHQAGAISGTFGLSIGALLLAARYRRSIAGRIAVAVAIAGTVALALLTLANFDIEPFGIGRREAWALYQALSLVCMVALVLVLPAALRAGDRAVDPAG